MEINSNIIKNERIKMYLNTTMRLIYDNLEDTEKEFNFHHVIEELKGGYYLNKWIWFNEKDYIKASDIIKFLLENLDTYKDYINQLINKQIEEHKPFTTINISLSLNKALVEVILHDFQNTIESSKIKPDTLKVYESTISQIKDTDETIETFEVTTYRHMYINNYDYDKLLIIDMLGYEFWKPYIEKMINNINEVKHNGYMHYHIAEKVLNNLI